MTSSPPEADYRIVRGGAAADGIGAILPAGTVAVYAHGPVTPDPVFPSEAAHVIKAVESRRLEHARGRTCARRALQALELPAAAIPTDTDRAPIWPAGVVGSITHCREAYCCAALALDSTWSAIGIDAELLRSLEPGVRDKILVPSEVRAVAALDPSIPWECVTFSIKEAIYKALFPSLRRWIDFHEVAVTLSPADGTFTATGPVPLEGRFAIDGGLVLSAVVR